MPKSSRIRSVSITTEQDDYLSQHDISLSRLVQGELSDMMKCKDPHRYVSLSELKIFRKQNLLITLLGTLLIVASLTLKEFLYLAHPTVPVITMCVGSIVTVVGIYQLFGWEQYIRRRSKMSEHVPREKRSPKKERGE